jgi:hypothetical protein
MAATSAVAIASTLVAVRIASAAVNHRFFGPAAVAPFYPECASSVHDDGWAPWALTYVYVKLPGQSDCNNFLLRPANFITVDMTQTWNVNGAFCQNNTAANLGNTSGVAVFTGCGNGVQTRQYRSSHWYKFNGNWYTEVCRKAAANAGAVCPTPFP